MTRWLFLLVLLAALLARFAPGTLLDAGLSAVTDGRLRILHASGTLWSGEGTFASLTADGRSAQPWLSARWEAEFDQLTSGRLGWRLSESDRTVLRAQLGPDGAELSEAAFDAPLKALLDSVPHALARAGWHGSARLESPGWFCDWQRRCRGSLRLEWIDASADLVPGRRLGDYEVSATASGRSGRFSVRTMDGEIHLNGEGGWNDQGRPHFKGQVKGPAEIVSRLPNVMDGVAFATDDPGVAELVLR